jgi:hypothetical protein
MATATRAMEDSAMQTLGNLRLMDISHTLPVSKAVFERSGKVPDDFS